MRHDSGPAPIYFDANPLSDRHLTGIGRYTARLALATRSHREVRFFVNERRVIPPSDLDWSQDQDLSAWARRIWQGTKESLGTTPAGSIAVYSMLRPLERRFDHEMSIIYDMTPLILPHTHREGTRGNFQGFCSKAITSSDAAIAISHSTKADAEWLAAFDPDRIFVAYPGPSQCINKHAFAGEVSREGDFGLVVSTLEPRKNPEAFCDWFHTSACLPDDAELWWVGSIGWITSKRDLKAFETRPGSRRRIRFLGVVSDAELCRLYRSAAWSAYPSLYEGFGFPVLDSLRHGTPVLCSANSSLVEFDSPGLFRFDPARAATLDRAYRDMQAWRDDERAEPIEPLKLDRLYHWSKTSEAIIEACEGPSRRNHLAAPSAKLAASR